MAPKYVLHYFNARGRAETFRWMFALKGVDYEDKRYTKEEFAEFKSKTPYGQLPVLEVDGEMICQTRAMALYLSRELGLSGECAMSSARITEIIDCLDDAMQPMMKYFGATDEEEKKGHMTKYVSESLPKFVKFVASKLSGGKQYLVGDKLSVADLMVVRILFEMEGPAADVVKGCSEVQALIDRITGLPAIAEWIKKRPVTQF